jgi:mono/diheme cytochrome c family protein
MRTINVGALAAAILVAALSSVAAARAFNVPHRAQAASSPAVERGRYLVVAAGQCSDCHGNTLQGASIDFLAPDLPPVVQRSAPKIAGLPMFDDDAAAMHFLETGELPGGAHARPPMPQYRFDHNDAVAIVTYLKTLR